ncbi:succinylglutamate desuccinylase/aspartoacylase family protein [Pseudenhygromyxa sp. WMMC2535]|nr:succinylglutamate desuccinylase/aspartoacylase family protein [Pseudenhygromyxa sp. WMMC2535]
MGVELIHDGSGNALHLPVIVARGQEDGPVFGVTAVVHGNEVNGIRVIQKLFAGLEPTQLRGTVVGVPIVNLPAYLANSRTFYGFDLNRTMPGREGGNSAEVYAHRFLDRIVSRFNYLIDLHTASFGRINSLYVRANLEQRDTAKMAALQHPEIVVHNEAKDGTLREAAGELGISAITVEVGNPLRFQARLIRDSLAGVRNVLSELQMIPDAVDPPGDPPVFCSGSSWIYAHHGGLLRVYPDVTDEVEEGEVIASVTNVFGDVIAEYRSPISGVIVGRSTNPICQTGARVAHIANPASRAQLKRWGVAAAV